jgi:hypothetical protein
MSTASDTAPGGRLAGLLDSPITGMSPWIVFSVLAGPGRFEAALGLALLVAVALVTMRTMCRRGSALKIPEVLGVAFFVALAALGAVASPGTHDWLETYADENSNLTLVLTALGSMAVKAPFTAQYAREGVGREGRHPNDFLRAHYVITGVWGLAFVVAAFAGALGDLVLRNPGNLWTGWIIQITAFVAAWSFTEWYPRLVRSRTLVGEPPPPVRSLLIPLVGLLIGTGIVVLLLDAGASWFGVGLIVAGIVLARAIEKDVTLTNGGDRRGFN